MEVCWCPRACVRVFISSLLMSCATSRVILSPRDSCRAVTLCLHVLTSCGCKRVTLICRWYVIITQSLLSSGNPRWSQDWSAPTHCSQVVTPCGTDWSPPSAVGLISGVTLCRHVLTLYGCRLVAPIGRWSCWNRRGVRNWRQPDRLCHRSQLWCVPKGSFLDD